MMLTSACVVAGLVVASLALNLEQLARFNAYWSSEMSLSSASSLVLTVAASVVAVVAIVLAAGSLPPEAEKSEIRQSESV
jgi:hypothetical protein